MGVSQSSYVNLEHRPFIDNNLHEWESGTEYMRFIDTTWCDVRMPNETSAGSPIYKQKVLKVQGSESGEIYYMSKESLVDALGSDLRETSKFVNSKKDHEVFCIWKKGFVRDKKGRTQEIQLAMPQRPVLGSLMLRHVAA